MTEPIARPVRGGRAGLEPATNGLPTGLTRPEQLTIRHSSGRVIDDDGSLIRVYTARVAQAGCQRRHRTTRGAPRRPWRRCLPTTCADDYRAAHGRAALRLLIQEHAPSIRWFIFNRAVLFAVLGDVKVCGRRHFMAGMNAPSVVSSVAAIDGKLRTALIRSSRARNSLPIATGRPRSSSSPAGA